MIKFGKAIKFRTVIKFEDRKMEKDIERFDMNLDPTALGPRWKRWMRSFELYVESQGINDSKRKTAMLLHRAGPDVQEIFDTLSPAEEGDVYEAAKTVLNAHFAPKVNFTYERHVFRSITQEQGESHDRFLVRLKQQAKNCNFKDNEDDQIIDQVIEKCVSGKLRRQLLVKEDLTLGKVGEAARLFEAAERQASAIETKSEGTSNVNRLQIKGNTRKKTKEGPGKKDVCYRCGNTDHYAKSKDCPAWGKQV